MFFLKVAMGVGYFLIFLKFFIVYGRASINGCKSLGMHCRTQLQFGYFAGLKEVKEFAKNNAKRFKIKSFESFISYANFLINIKYNELKIDFIILVHYPPSIPSRGVVAISHVFIFVGMKTLPLFYKEIFTPHTNILNKTYLFVHFYNP
jgi:hypothetical protein